MRVSNNSNLGIFMNRQLEQIKKIQFKVPSLWAHSKAHGHVRRPLLGNRQLMSFLVLFVVLGGGVFVGTRTVVHNWDSIFAGAQEFIARQIDARVKSVMVSGTNHTQPAQLREALGVARGDSLVGFDAQQARRKLEALDWVKSAGVVRILPSTLEVDITEFVPLSRIKYNRDVWILGTNGQLITKEFEGFEDLPVVRGKGAQENTLKLFTLLAEAGLLDKMIAAYYVGERRWNVEFKSGVIAKLPQEDVAQAVAYLRVLQEERALVDVPDVMVDLRLPDKIVLRLPDGAERDFL